MLKLPNNAEESTLKILYLSSEIAPFSRTGGLGDVAGALPKALKAWDCEVRMVTPHYRFIRDRRYGLREISRLRTLQFSVGDKVYNCAAKSGFLRGAKVQVYFIVADDLFNRESLYIDPETGLDWPDNHIRFGLLSQASLQLMQHLKWMPDIIHCNDWQTALTIYLARRYEDCGKAFKHTRLIFQVHNFAFQGLLPLPDAKEIGFCEPDLAPGGIAEFYGKASLLKAGLYLADQIITVSPTYAKEVIESEETGCGLSGVLRERNEHLRGILSGVDTDIWNPAEDRLLARIYDSSTVTEGKAFNKADLQKRLKLPLKPDLPLIGMISRLTEQKGLDLLAAAASELLELPAQFVFLGVGESRYQELLTGWASRYPAKVAVNFNFDDKLAHQIEAAADIFLMPSRFEPGGLNQLYSLLYGTIPVVRATGGLADTVIDYQTDPEKGNGFVFQAYEVSALMGAVQRALALFPNKTAWKELQLRGMASDFSWTKSAQQYLECYQEALAQPAFA